MDFEKELSLKKNAETINLINQIMGKLDAIKDYIEGLDDMGCVNNQHHSLESINTEVTDIYDEIRWEVNLVYNQPNEQP